MEQPKHSDNYTYSEEEYSEDEYREDQRKQSSGNNNNCSEESLSDEEDELEEIPKDEIESDEEEHETEGNSKTCTRCNKEKHIRNFISMVNGTETRRCIDCRNHRNNYDNERKLHQVYHMLKSTMQPCVMCGDSNKDHLEFNHMDQSDKISEVCHIRTEQGQIDESEKCLPYCKKCHRKYTSDNEQYGHRKTENLTHRDNMKNIAREFIKLFKIQLGGCQNPGCCDKFDSDNLSFYEFDHIHFLDKIYNISYMIISGMSIESIKKELLKCVLLCGYCHKIKTRDDLSRRREYYTSLERPLKKKEKQKRVLPKETVNEIRQLYNSTTLNRQQLANKFNLKIQTIKRIVNNVTYKDENYQKTKMYRLTMDDAKKIRELYNENPEIEKKEIMEKFKLSSSRIGRLLNNEIFFDENYTRSRFELKQFTTEVVKEIREDFDTKRLNKKQLAAKHEISASHLDKILNNELYEDPNYINNRKKKRMTLQDAQNIRKLFDSKQRTKKQLAEEYNVQQSQITRILNNTRHTDSNYKPAK
jgi:hypothetical protein